MEFNFNDPNAALVKKESWLEVAGGLSDFLIGLLFYQWLHVGDDISI